MNDFETRGPFARLLIGDVQSLVQLNGCSRNLSLTPRAYAVAQYRVLCGPTDVSIALYEIRQDDLLALALIWDGVDTKHVHIAALGKYDAETVKGNIAVLQRMLRHPRVEKKTITVAKTFLDAHLALLFEDIVFDSVDFDQANEVNGWDVPR